MGVGADVASGGELQSALEVGIPPQCIEFSGPGKSEREIAAAIRHAISSINVESLAELEIVVRESLSLGLRASVGVRVNPGVIPGEAGLKMSGATQFGIPITQLEDALNFIRDNPATMNFTGLHVHAGSQLLSSEAIAQSFRSTLDIAKRIVDLGVLPLRKINFGGGWGIAYFPHQSPLDLSDLAPRLADLFAEAAYQTSGPFVSSLSPDGSWSASRASMSPECSTASQVRAANS